jgi:hypothetical protein
MDHWGSSAVPGRLRGLGLSLVLSDGLLDLLQLGEVVCF